MKKFKSIFFIALMLNFSVFVLGQKSLLFIGGNANVEDHAADKDMVDSLEAWGYTVNYMADDAYNAESGLSVYDGMDGVFINEPVGSTEVTKFGSDNYPLPCINLEGSAVRTSSDRWGWVDDVVHSGDGNASELDLSIIITDITHYITKNCTYNQEIKWANYSGDFTNDNLTASLEEVNVTYSGKLAINKALQDNSNVWNMITVDSSDAFPNNMFFWSISSISLAGATKDQHNGTNDYYNLIKRACQWVLNEMEQVNIKKQKDNKELSLVAFPNPATENLIIRFKSPVIAPANITFYNTTGQQVHNITVENIQAGNNFQNVKTDKLASGIYIVKLEINGDSEFVRIAVE